VDEVERAATPLEPDPVTCPWCGSAAVGQLRDFGSLLMTSQWFCEACGSPFERIRLRGSDADRPA
jgi:hypothetical protein